PLPFYPDLATPDDPSSGFQLTVYSPRFSTGYFPQRNRFTVLVETHSWKDYATRVRVTRNTIVALAELLAAHGEAWREQALGAGRGWGRGTPGGGWRGGGSAGGGWGGGASRGGSGPPGGGASATPRPPRGAGAGWGPGRVGPAGPTPRPPGHFWGGPACRGSA